MKSHFVKISLPIFALVLYLSPINQAEAAPGLKSPGADCRVRILADGDYFQELMKAVGGAQREIIMAFYLFKTNGYRSNYPDRLLDGLAAAARRGVKVRVILERTSDSDSSLDAANRETADRLKSRGIDVRFDPPSITTHVKMIVIDGRLTFIGSHNMTNSALKYNREVSLVIESSETADKAVRYFDSLCR